MPDEKQSRRKFLIGGAAAVAGTTGLVFLVNALRKMDRVNTETSNEIQTAWGVVKERKIVEGDYIESRYEWDPTTDLDPMKEMKRLPDKHNISVVYGKGNRYSVTLDNKRLYGQVEQGSEVRVQYREVFRVRRNHKGELLERKLTGHRVVRVIP